VRRIEALTGLVAVSYLQDQLDQRSLKVDELNRQLLDLKKSIDKERTQALQREAEQIVGRFKLDQKSIVEVLKGANGEQLQAIANTLKAKKFAGVAVLFGKEADQVHVLAAVDPSFTHKVQAGKIVQELTGLLGGKGGGKPDLARGAGKDSSKVDLAKARAVELTANI
jgi:alanyl-tRNA synthetase